MTELKRKSVATSPEYSVPGGFAPTPQRAVKAVEESTTVGELTGICA